MPFDRARRVMESLRRIVVFQPRRVEPFLQRRRPATVSESTSLPNAAKIRNFVEAGTAACLHSKHRVCPHGDVQDVTGL